MAEEQARMLASDEIVKVEEYKIERFVTLGLGRYDAVRAVESLVNERGCPLAVAVEIAR